MFPLSLVIASDNISVRFMIRGILWFFFSPLSIFLFCVVSYRLSKSLVNRGKLNDLYVMMTVKLLLFRFQLELVGYVWFNSIKI